MSLVRKMYTSSAWLMLGTLYNNIVGFAVFALLARLLSADAIGAVMAAVVFIDFGRILIFGGIQEIGVKRETFDDTFLSTSFWLNILAAAIVTAAVVFAVAPVVSTHISADTGRALILMSCMFVIDGARAAHITKLRRELAFASIAMRGLYSNTLAGAVAVWLAWMGYGADAMIFQRICQAVITTVVTWRAARWMPSFAFDLWIAWDTFVLGLRVTGSRILEFWSSRLPDLILGWFVGPAALAVYRVGLRCLELGTQVLVQPIQDVAISVFSRQSDVAEREKSLENLTKATSIVLFPAFLGLGAIGPSVVPILFGDNWAQAADVMALTSLFAVPLVLNKIIFSYVLVGSGRGNELVYMNLFGTVANGLLCLAGLRFGLMGVSLAVVVSAFVSVAFSGFFALRHHYPRVGRFFMLTLGGFAASVGMAACVYFAGLKYGGLISSPFLRVAALVALGVVIHGSVVLVVWRRQVLGFAKTLRRKS